MRVPRRFLLGILLILALIAFEAFNFDTTRYALQNLLGDVRFAGFAWATILAVAFCAIDFAGLGRLLTPERGKDEPKEIWYLTGAWLLGASMNAVMTWWAVSTVLLSHPLGNEILSREQLVQVVPVFVAVLVWITRILFIGAVTMAGERLLHGDDRAAQGLTSVTSQATANSFRPQAGYAAEELSAVNRQQAVLAKADESRSQAVGTASHRTQRPPRPGMSATRQSAYSIQAEGRRKR